MRYSIPIIALSSGALALETLLDVQDMSLISIVEQIPECELASFEPVNKQGCDGQAYCKDATSLRCICDNKERSKRSYFYLENVRNYYGPVCPELRGIFTYADQICFKIQSYPTTTSLDEINKAQARFTERVKAAKPIDGRLDRNNCVELYGQPAPEDDHAGVFPDNLGGVGGTSSDSEASSGPPSSSSKKNGASSLVPISAISGLVVLVAAALL